MTAHNSVRLRGSNPVVGSSRKRTGASATRAPARSRRRRMPPEYVFAGRSAASARSNRSSSSRALAFDRFLPRWYSRPIMSKFSNPVRCSSTAAYWPDRPMCFLTSPGEPTTSAPATVAVPESGSRSVVRIDTAVVLPAPLGPSSPRIVPSGTVRSRPSKATTSPYLLTRPRASMMSFI